MAGDFGFIDCNQVAKRFMAGERIFVKGDRINHAGLSCSEEEFKNALPNDVIMVKGSGYNHADYSYYKGNQFGAISL